MELLATRLQVDNNSIVPNFNNLTNVPADLLDGDDVGITVEVDGDTTNELQVLTISNDTLFLSNGGFVVLPSNAGVFENVGGIVRNTGDDDTDDFIFGNDAIDGDETTQFFFDKSKGAFRAGAGNANWSINNLGDYSFALGDSSIASGTRSIAMGEKNIAFHNNTIAIGLKNTASKVRSVAIGSQNTSSAFRSLAMGSINTASGSNSTAIGIENIASGSNSTAIGIENIASGSHSTAIGRENIASGSESMTMGYKTQANGRKSTSMGNNTQANGNNSLAIGLYNDTIVSPNASGSNNPLFMVGNGANDLNRSNALTVFEDGRMQINDTYTLPVTDGDSLQVITTDGNGNLSWNNMRGCVCLKT